MLLRTLENMENFTNTEIAIAKYILQHKEEIYSLSAEELAKRTYSSKASITRLCKKAGCDNFHEFKQKIEIEVIEYNRIATLLNEEPITKDTKLKDIIQIIPSIYDKSISETMINLNQNTIQRIINRLASTTKISIYGSGISSTIASQAAFKFMTLGIECNAYNGLNEHYIKANKDNHQQIAFIISFTGNNVEMIRIAEFLKKNSIYVVGIGSNEGVLSKHCDEYIETYLKKQLLSMEVITSFMATVYVIDILFVSLLVRDYDDNVEAAIKVLNEGK